MADINVPQFDYPFRFEKNGNPAVIEQNSEKDVMNCVTAALKTRRGTRLYVPNFGVDDLTFSEFPLDENSILSQLADSEPRATLGMDQSIQDLVAKIEIGVGLVE